MNLPEKHFSHCIEDIEGVSNVALYGITDSVISVKIDNDKLAENQIPLQSVMGVLQGQNTALAVGERIIDGKTSNIKVIGDLTSLEKLKNLTITPNITPVSTPGEPSTVPPKITLGEIATIEETKNSDFVSRFNGKESLDISITKDSNSNAVSISKEVEKVTKEIE